MTRNDVKKVFGLEILQKLEKISCVPSGRVGFLGRSHGDQFLEYVSTLPLSNGKFLKAFFYVDNSEEAVLDSGDEISWSVSHYGVY